MRLQLLLLLVGSIGCLGTLGCKSLDLKKNAAEVQEEDLPWWKKDDLPPAETPAKIVAFWTNSVFNEPGKQPIRGLGGRVYFYDAKHKPVRVDGKLTVFLYDDTNQNQREKQEATKKIDFSAEEVAAKYTPSEFGASYSFWLPWDEVGGYRAQLSVIPVFTSKNGEMLVGQQAPFALTGKKPPALADDASHPPGGVVAASFEDHAGDTENTIRLKSTTIKLPRSVQQRLRTSVKPIRDRSKSSIRNSANATQLSPTAAASPQRNRKPAGTFGTRPEVGKKRTRLQPETFATQTKPATTDSEQLPPADSQRDLRQAQALRSAQQASARDPNLLDRAKSLFDRSR